jgi:glyoxylase-like metal-dependent hydrolase (beta-lactamase superfamily II)
MKITPLTASEFRSDGGAMFGLVPKVIWQKLCPAGEDNTIPQRANVLLLETGDGRLGLVDCGCGDPAWMSGRERLSHGMDLHWPLRDQLTEQGVCFMDISFILLTHAHWDHAGALADPDGKAVFPNADIYIREKEMSLALGGDPLLYKAYPPQVVHCLRSVADRIHTLDDRKTEVLPGLHLLPAVGHTEGQGCVWIEEAECAGQPGVSHPALFAGDNCPTRHHLRMVYQTGYDILPLATRQWKRDWWPRCVRENILLLFCHDADVRGGWLLADSKREFVLREVYP